MSRLGEETLQAFVSSTLKFKVSCRAFPFILPFFFLLSLLMVCTRSHSLSSEELTLIYLLSIIVLKHPIFHFFSSSIFVALKSRLVNGQSLVHAQKFPTLPLTLIGGGSKWTLLTHASFHLPHILWGTMFFFFCLLQV